MKYEDFVCFVRAEVAGTMGEEAKVELTKVKKNNGVELDGLVMGKEKCRIAPTIYLNGYYEQYEKGRTVAEIVSEICELYQNCKTEVSFGVEKYTEYENVKGNLACKLINREKNREMLQEIPYLKFLNLAIVAYYRVKDDKIGTGSIVVQKSHLELWGISEEQLFYEARRNMKKILPERFVNIAKILEMDPLFEEPDEDPLPMYVLTNEECCFGAACIIFDSVLKEIGEVLQDDYWVIPSSIHECIILPMQISMTADEIAAMVYQVNCENVAQEDYLSDNVYCYKRKSQKLQIAHTKIA